MPSPFRKDQLSPAMVERYGLDRRSWGTGILVAGTLLASAAAIVLVSINLTRAPIDVNVIGWDESPDDHVVVDFIVSRPADLELECAIRAQDRTHVDVGYGILRVPAGEQRVRLSYPLAIIAKSANAEVLGCAEVGTLRVIEPAFPPGVVPPQQPYTP